MSGKNYLLRKQTDLINETYRTAERITRQYDLDTLQITLSRYPKLNLGYDRIMEICELWDAVKEEYHNALQRHPEQDYYLACMDRELAQIMAHRADKLIPAEKRYPELRKPL